MATSRLQYAMERGGLTIPKDARVVLLEPPVEEDLSWLDGRACVIQQNMKPAFDHFKAYGFNLTLQAEGRFDAAVVFVPKSRPLAKGLIAQAADLAREGVVIVTGAKTAGVEAQMKAIRSRVGLDGQVSKAHGKAFWFSADADLNDWTLENPSRNTDGWVTAPGVFSADGVDAGSAALIEALPKGIKGRVADLGGGWGYLSHHIAELPGVTRVNVVEADHRALECARLNVTQPNVEFHWADATLWGDKASCDWVVMNPPFHPGRSADPALGQAFIKNAARILKPKGSLVMVANRHLPYESTLQGVFAKVEELTGDARFKIFRADAPKQLRR